MNFGERLRKIRLERGLTQSELAERLKTTKQTIFKYETGIVSNIPLNRVEDLAAALNVDPAWLMGWDESANLPDGILQMPSVRKIPLIGTIACGTPILANENYEGEVEMPENIRADFALRCRGDSMINARIYNGDIVYIRQQPEVENGEIAAILIDDEATLKRVRYDDNHVTLWPENPAYSPLIYWGEDMEKIKILGKAVAFTSIVK